MQNKMLRQRSEITGIGSAIKGLKMIDVVKH